MPGPVPGRAGNCRHSLARPRQALSLHNRSRLSAGTVAGIATKLETSGLPEVSNFVAMPATVPADNLDLLCRDSAWRGRASECLQLPARPGTGPGIRPRGFHGTSLR